VKQRNRSILGVAWMQQAENAYRILVGKSVYKREFGSTKDA
jgi:hypothetical protein